ncbi:MAG: rod shape-determining protein MreD [Fimbriimonadia bacterium]|nr:rod shape-determining protein MreD [Fimbriimonadia bacterium]
MRKRFIETRAPIAGRATQWVDGKRIIVIALIILFAVSAQGVWATAMQVGVAAPDFTLLALAFIALQTQPATGATAGFFIGLMQGALSAQTLGSYALSRVFGGFIVGWLPVWFERSHILMTLTACIMAVVVSETALFLLAPRNDFVDWILRVGGKIVYNIVLALPVYAIIKRLIPPEPAEQE